MVDGAAHGTGGQGRGGDGAEGQGVSGRGAGAQDGTGRRPRRRLPGLALPTRLTRDRWRGRFTRCPPATRLGRVLAGRVRQVRRGTEGVPADAGMATAEYAVVMIAAVGFAGLLVVILTSPEIRETLTALVRGALSV